MSNAAVVVVKSRRYPEGTELASRNKSSVPGSCEKNWSRSLR